MSYRDRLIELRDRVERGRVGAAADLAQDVADSEPEVTELLREFRTAVRNEEYDLTESILAKLRERYDVVRSEENVVIAKSLAVRADPEIPEADREAAQEYLQRASAMDLHRAGFMIGAATVLARPEEADQEGVSSSASSLEEEESEKAEAQDQADEAASDATLPPTVAMNVLRKPEGTFLEGSSFPLDVRVTNAGDDPAESVVVRFDVPGGLSLDSSLLRIGRIGGGETATDEVTVTGETPGSYTLSAEVTADNADPDVEELQLTVQERSAELTAVEEIIGVDGEAQFDDVITAISLFNQGEPVPGTDKHVSFQDVLEVIAAYNTEESGDE